MEIITVIKNLLLLLTVETDVLSAYEQIYKSTDYDCNCGEIRKEITNRIVGGKITKPHAYPWQALVKISKGKKIEICGGTVINDVYILTVAKCTYGIPTKSFTILLGQHDQYSEPTSQESYKVKNIINHENYKKPIGIYNIALLKRDRQITFNDFIKPICLPLKDEKIEGKTTTVIGWGSTGGKNMSKFLRETDVQVLKYKVCQRYNKKMHITNICSNGLGNGFYEGDKGGPMFYVNDNGMAVQIGIIGFKNTGCFNRPSYYTSVIVFIDWIRKHTKCAHYCYKVL